MLTQSTVVRDGSQYAATLAKQEFRAELERLFPTGRGQRTPDEIRFQMLRFHQNRCVFNVNMTSNNGWQSLIAKLFAVDRPDTFDVMNKIHQAGFGPTAQFAIPKPFAYISSLRILLEEKVEGKQVKSILLGDDQSEQIRAVRRCGEWLNRFHTTAPRFGNRVDPRAFLEHVREWADMISKFGEPLTAKCESLMKKLQDSVPNEGTFEYCPGHGSYIPSHVLLSDKRTVTIDFDELELVDPARDLAWFLIALERFELKYQRPSGFYERLAPPFLEAYLKEGNRDNERHLAFYKGAEYLHRARHDLYKRIPPAPEWAEKMLDQAITGL
ncbi:MAG TPA: aminoglycoside phosphotransferase family protein [Candidatus Angelobacter sp.]|nr:aminoglycoside phosphotransferase family protein [Candidatus Angelobacter sp.]